METHKSRFFQKQMSKHYPGVTTVQTSYNYICFTWNEKVLSLTRKRCYSQIGILGYLHIHSLYRWIHAFGTAVCLQLIEFVLNLGNDESLMEPDWVKSWTEVLGTHNEPKQQFWHSEEGHCHDHVNLIKFGTMCYKSLLLHHTQLQIFSTIPSL